jgi:hypothetical protein
VPGEPPPNKKKSANLSCLNLHPANLIRLAYSEINYGSANGKADGRGEMVKKLQDNSPINLAVTSRNGIRSFAGNRHV